MRSSRLGFGTLSPLFGLLFVLLLEARRRLDGVPLDKFYEDEIHRHVLLVDFLC